MSAATWVLVWLVWYGLVIASFVALEAWALATGGVTFTGTVAWLRDHHATWAALLGAFTVALVAWLVWHFWLEPDFLPRLRRTWWDDGLIAAVVAAVAYLFARRQRKRADAAQNEPQPKD